MASEVTTADITTNVIDDDKPVDQVDISSSTDVEIKFNEFKIVCKKCSCVILRPNQAKLVSQKIELPMVSTRKDEESVRETLDDHLEVNDIYTYENMGFSNTVEGVKYLVCAECEYGPLGLMNNNEKKSYLSLDRVLQKKDN